MRKVDIVIPIYNAYDFTNKCIETVINNTDLSFHTLVLINDKSPDLKILPMLEKYVHDNPDLNIKLINNKENKGFVKNVNIGLTNSSNDVILLNSDTEVTKRWLEKMQECAYSDNLVATVTPLSNNATLASVPKFNFENELPKNISLEEYAKIIEDCSLNSYPEIPTAHGFCMYIKREAIDVVGLFDEELFEKGYGEENDFSYRCLEAGYRHLLCDNTYIYHKGTQSFTEAKKEFILSHLKILMEKYPACFNNTDNFVRDNPIEYIQQNVIYSTNSYKRKNLLFLVHDFRDLSEKNLGGTTLHIYDLIANLRKKYNIHIVFPYLHDGNCYVKSYFEEETYTHNLGQYKKYTNFELYNKSFKNDMDKIVKLLHIDLIHIHHLKGLYLDIFDVAKENGIPVIYTLHDFYCICPTIQLLDENNKYCGLLEKKDCKKCICQKFGVNTDVIKVWQNEFYKRLNECNKIIVPSENTKVEILNSYKDLNIDVIEHGFDVYNKNIDINENKNNTFNIAFIGGINDHKGLKYLEGLLSKIQNTDIVIHLFGTVSKEQYNCNKKNYVYHGVYDRADISELLIKNNIKLACMLQIWPETYSYILTESIASKVPVIALDIGAVADRVKKIDAGYIMDINSSVDDVYNKIVAIKSNVKEYNNKKKNIEKHLSSIKSIKDMAKEYDKIYEDIIKNSKKNDLVYDENKLKEEFYFKKEINNSLLIEKKKYDILNQKFNQIIYSKRWRFIGKLRFPRFFRK